MKRDLLSLILFIPAFIVVLVFACDFGFGIQRKAAKDAELEFFAFNPPARIPDSTGKLHQAKAIPQSLTAGEHDFENQEMDDE